GHRRSSGYAGRHAIGAHRDHDSGRRGDFYTGELADADKQFRDLNAVERRALAQLVARHPEVQRVGAAQVFADSPDEAIGQAPANLFATRLTFVYVAATAGAFWRSNEIRMAGQRISRMKSVGDRL